MDHADDPFLPGLMIAFQVPMESFRTELGNKVFSEILTGVPEADNLPRREPNAVQWAKGDPTAVTYHVKGADGYHHVVLQSKRLNQYDVPPLSRFRPPKGMAILVVETANRDLVAASVMNDVACKLFDCLQPPWGCLTVVDDALLTSATAFEEMPHWQLFLGPGQEPVSTKLREASCSVSMRPWGGIIIRCWENPSEPPPVNRVSEIGAILRSAR